MVDLSLNRNFINPPTATHSIFFLETKPTEMTLFSHVNVDNVDDDEIILDIHHNNIFQVNGIFEENVGKRQTTGINNEFGSIKHEDRGNSINKKGTILSNNDDRLFKKSTNNRERTKSSFNPSLPLPISLQKDKVNLSGKQVTVQHSINIAEPFDGGNKEQEYYDLPSAESTQSHGGSGNNNNHRDTVNLDYVDVDYVNRGSQIDVVSPSSQILTHMHQIRPTYIPRSTEKPLTTQKSILNPLLDPKFQPISSTTGKRWSVRNTSNKPNNSIKNGSKNNVLKASIFPELPSLDGKRNRANEFTCPGALANIGLSSILSIFAFNVIFRLNRQ
jgi:hypothetical protein